MKRTRVYGLMAEFDSVNSLMDAANARGKPVTRGSTLTARFPVEGLAEAIGFHHDEVPLVVLIGGLIGGLGGYLMQYWISVVSYPVNVGGKPYHSWPAFIVPDIRVDHSLCRDLRGIRHAGAQRPAYALSSRIQCSTLRVRDQRQVFPDRVLLRSEVQPDRSPPLSGRPGATLHFGGARLRGILSNFSGLGWNVSAKITSHPERGSSRAGAVRASRGLPHDTDSSP